MKWYDFIVLIGFNFAFRMESTATALAFGPLTGMLYFLVVLRKPRQA